MGDNPKMQGCTGLLPCTTWSLHFGNAPQLGALPYTLKLGLAKSSPTFWECPSPMGFIYHKARGKIYMNQTYVDHEVYEYGGEQGVLCLLLDSGRVLTPTSKHNFPSILQE